MTVLCKLCQYRAPINHGLCKECDDKVLEYFNDHIYQDEKVWNRTRTTLKTLDSDIEYHEVDDVIYANESELWDTEKENNVPEDREELIDYIVATLITS